MRRKYLTQLYAERISTIKALRSDCCIGVDVIVGFPGETDEDFAETIDFLNGIDISYLHVFTYSERANTGAVKLGERVPMEKRKERSKILHQLSDKKKHHFYTSQLGTERSVLWEADEENGMMYGFTENYIKVKSSFDPSLVNTFQNVTLLSLDRDGIVKV